jgi:hypothetical protein
MTGVDFDLGSFEKTLRRNKACETKSVYSLHQIIKLYAETHSHAMNSLGEQQSLRYFSASGIPSMELISEWGNDFVPAETPGSERVEQGDKVNLVMRQMYLPNLPHDRRVAQITWQASHWFEDGKKSEVSHVTSCEAVAAGSAAAVGLPIFERLKVTKGIGLRTAIYVTADRGSQAHYPFAG